MAFGSLRNCEQLSTGGSLWPLYSIDFAETTNCRLNREMWWRWNTPRLGNVALKHPEEIDEIGAYGICFKWVHIWISCNILYTEMVHVEKYWPTFPLACGHFWPSVEVEPPKLGGAKVNMFHVRTEQHWGNRFPNLTHCANIFQWQKTVWTSRDDSLELLMKSTLKAL